MERRRDLISALFALIIAMPTLAIGGGINGINGIYIFGDSLSDQGNLFDATYSLAGFGIPRADYYESGRFTNGDNWVDVLASQLGVTSMSSFSGGNNFAYGGTRTDYNTVELNNTKPDEVNELATLYVPHGNAFPRLAFPWTLNAQRVAFEEYGVNDPDALYVVWSGSNDLFDISFMAEFEIISIGDDVPEWISDVIEGINVAIEAMVDAGAQEIMVPNVPNLGVVPGFAGNPGLARLATDVTTEFNSALDAMLATWVDDVNIIPFDTFTLLGKVVVDPAAYNFTYSTTPCYSGFVVVEFDENGNEITETECANPDEYVFWDTEHPTAAFHALLAQRAFARLVPDMLDYLTLQVSKLHVQDKNRNALNKKLNSASQKHADGKRANAASKLKDFIEVVQKMQGKEIPEDEAASMIMRADKVIALLYAEQ